MTERWILQICHGYSGPFLDVARQYAALFKASPYKVLTVYLTGERSIEATQGSASDEVIFLNYSSRKIRGLKLEAINDVRDLASRRNFVLVIAHRFKPIYVACLATRLPVIGVHHAFGDYDRIQRRAFVRLFRHRLALLGVSDAVRDDIRKNLANWPQQQIETLHNRLDVKTVRSQLISRQEARNKLGLPQEAIVIANVGRLHPDKDQATLLRGFATALPHLPKNSLLVIAGQGPLEGKIKAQAQHLGIANSVHFLGQVHGIRRFFPAFDLFVLSSDHEPFGMVLLEAMAAHVPIFATDCGGAPEIVEYPEQLFPLRNSVWLATMLVEFFTVRPAEYHQSVTERANRDLCDKFTDVAARQRFFALPMIQPHIVGH